MTQSSHCVLFACLTSLVACGARPTVPARTAETPVWWSPDLALENLNHLPERQRTAFEDRLEVTRPTEPSQVALMDNCSSYLRLRPQGYEPREDQSFTVMQHYGAVCRSLELLARAKSSADASLAGFLGEPGVLRRLPAVLGPQASPVDVERQEAAVGQELSWGEVEPGLVVDEQSARTLELSHAGKHTKLELFATGDFDGDRRQDALVKTTSYGDEGNWTTIRLWLLGQSDSGPLRVLQKLEL